MKAKPTSVQSNHPSKSVIQTKGYKMTEVGMIPEDWRFEPIGSFAKITTGAKDTQDRDDEGKYPFFVRSQKVERIRSYSFDGEAILTSGDGVGVGKIYHYINGKFDFHQRVYCMHDFREDVQGKYFFYQFSIKFYDRVMSMTAKSSVDSVRREMIADMKIPLPPTLSEQRAIATALSDLDTLISSLDKLIEKKKAIKQGTMQELLTGKTRLAGFGNGVGYKMTEVGRIPSDWEVKRIDEVLTFGSGQDYKHLSGGDFPVYGTGGIMTFVDDYLYDGDSVGIGRKGTIDKPVFLTGKFWTVDTLFYTHNFTECIPKFIYYKFLTIQWKEYNEASGVPSLNKNTLGKIIIAVPSISEQKAIATALYDIDSEIGELEAKRNKYTRIKQGMMQELLTGKTRLI